MRLIQQVPQNPAKICIVGEAPGEEEDRRGRPFIGYEGQILRKWFRFAGLKWHECFVTNTVHKRPYKNRYDTLSQEVIAEGRRQLAEDLERLKAEGLNLVVAVGAKALNVLTNRSQITKYRGAILPCTLVPGLKVLPIIHPGNIIRGNGRFEPICILDLKKAARESRFPEILYPERNILAITSETEALKLLHDLTDHPSPVVCDIETTGPVMVAYGIATSKREAFVISKELLQRPIVLRQLSHFCASSTPQVFHNALFDCLHNAYYYKILNNNIYCDTMLAQHAIYPTLLKSLAFCASIYTNEPYWKDLKEGEDVKDYLKDVKRGAVEWDSLYTYCGKDCCLTYEIMEIQQREIDEWGTRKAYDLMMSLIRPCLFAMLRGTKLDFYAIEEFRKKNERAIEVLEKIKEQTIGDVNTNSHVQLKKLIYKDWQLPVQKKHGKVTTNDEKLRKLERMPTPFKLHIGLIRKLRETKKKRDFYNLKHDPDGRIRTALKIHGTYTGRLASSESITGSGKNLLNIPKETRSFYKADEGKIFIQADLSQVEARIVAALSGNEEWLRKFDETDLHTETAALLFHIPYDKVDKKTHRQVAKRIAHGSHYRLGKRLMAAILGCSEREAAELQARYYEIRPGLREWQQRVERQVRKERVIRTVFGRVIQFFGPLNDKTFREAIAAEPQSTAADYLSSGLVRIYEADLPSWEFRLSVYDSILCQVDDDLNVITECMYAMKKLVEVPITVNGFTLTVPLDLELGYSWRDLKEVDDLNDIEKVYNELKI